MGEAAKSSENRLEHTYLVPFKVSKTGSYDESEEAMIVQSYSGDGTGERSYLLLYKPAIPAEEFIAQKGGNIASIAKGGSIALAQIPMTDGNKEHMHMRIMRLADRLKEKYGVEMPVENVMEAISDDARNIPRSHAETVVRSYGSRQANARRA